MNEEILRLLRIVNDYKQQAVADALNISQNTYSRLEKNPKRITADQAKKLADFYKISLSDLLSDKTPVITSGKIEISNQQPTTDSEIVSLKEQRDFLRTQHEQLLNILAKKKRTARNRKQ